jgi:hypothetical protein
MKENGMVVVVVVVAVVTIVVVVVVVVIVVVVFNDAFSVTKYLAFNKGVTSAW